MVDTSSTAATSIVPELPAAAYERAELLPTCRVAPDRVFQEQRAYMVMLFTAVLSREQYTVDRAARRLATLFVVEWPMCHVCYMGDLFRCSLETSESS